jgi:hypothetical protein
MDGSQQSKYRAHLLSRALDACRPAKQIGCRWAGLGPWTGGAFYAASGLAPNPAKREAPAGVPLAVAPTGA